ncbi:gustatory receptor for sugar taste 64e-like [Plutella xylostella]|uniref:gustatory receptor for sugar taste 64e-like n=1 Tax=Plutella xylostella TaxID=51655 RepID=UPI0020325BD0|nr:gustatory receptor for sugar taste 64e-like [Plutella xylostella]
MCEPKESKVNLPDYTATDLLTTVFQNFVQTFSRLMRRLRWLGIPWGGGLAQQGVAQALLASIFIGILSAVNRLFVAVDFGKIFLRVAGTSKYASAFFALLMIRRLKRSWPALAGAWTTSNHTLGALILPDAGLTRTIVRVATGFLVFATYQYTTLFGAIIFVQMLLTTLISNLQDFIVIAFSLGLTSRQKKINTVLKYLCSRYSYPNSIALVSTKYTTPVRVTAGKHLSWRKVREVFVRHAALVQATDRALGPLVLLSLFTNLLYILMLVFSLNYKNDKYAFTYSVYALAWLSVRCFSLLVAASDVHARSRAGADYFKNIQTTSYNTEVRRLQFQLSKNEIALSGMGFFKLKRSLILKVLSVIITYDLILLQYNDNL